MTQIVFESLSKVREAILHPIRPNRIKKRLWLGSLTSLELYYDRDWKRVVYLPNGASCTSDGFHDEWTSCRGEVPV